MQQPDPNDPDDPIAKARIEAKDILATKLTDRQRTALDLAAQDYTNDEIATSMRLAVRTVEDHLAAGRRNINAIDRRRAIRKYILLLDLADEPTRGYIRVAFEREEIENILRALAFENSVQHIGLDEVIDFMERFQSRGAEGLTARFGWYWKLAAAILGFVLIALGLALADDVAAFFDFVSAGGPS